ncbi:MAG: hypothetical protein SF029_22160 [bacterium]|nr:hypothetical protein [bacterium]
MSYSIEHFPELSVVVIDFGEDFGSVEEITAFASELNRLYNALSAPVYQIADVSRMKLDFEQAMDVIRLTVRSDKSIMKHPNNKGVVVVTTSRFYQLMIKGLNSAAFGMLKLQVFESLDAAMTWAREQAA